MQQTLSLPNIGDWATIDGAARLLGRDERTIRRMIEDGRLTRYRPYGAPDRTAACLVWIPEARELRDALKRARPPAGMS